jgi:hypothetical protein
VTHLFLACRSAVRPLAARIFFALILASALCAPVHAQATQIVTVRLIDGKTGQPIVPSNLMVRIDHLNAIHNEFLQLDDDGTGKVTVPAGTSFLSIQGTYESSMNIYVNCDAGMEKNTSTIHWYSIAVILNSGVAIPNECYKGKFADATHVTPKPGEFILFVRKNSWHEVAPD